MKIKIYQITAHTEEAAKASFTPFEQLENATGRKGINPAIYEKVFEGDVHAEDLEDVFMIFNADDRPGRKDFRSLSVSDIVETVNGNGETEYYYCDSVGFKKVEFEPERCLGKELRTDIEKPALLGGITLTIPDDNRTEFVGQLIDVFEDFLDERGIAIDNPEKAERLDVASDGLATIYGSDYGDLQQSIEGIIVGWADRTMQAEHEENPRIIENTFIDEFMALLEKYNIDKSKLKEISRGISQDFSKDSIALYADPKYDSDQMKQIRYGIKRGLSNDQVAIYADPKYNADQMQQIRRGITNMYDKDEIALYADPKYNANQMRVICLGIGDGLSKDEMSACANPDLTIEEMYNLEQEIRHQNEIKRILGEKTPFALEADTDGEILKDGFEPSDGSEYYDRLEDSDPSFEGPYYTTDDEIDV